jgi:hypothetical protein
MRRLIVLAIVALLGVAPLRGLSVWAQETGDEAGIGVEIAQDAAPMEKLDEFLGTSGSLRSRLTTGHLVAFENSGEMHAYVPEIPESEFMAVYVNSGEFVLDVMPPTSYIVETDGDRPIRRMNFSDEGSGADAVTIYTLDESDTGELLNENGAPCTEFCTVPPPQVEGDEPFVKEDRRTAIQLLPGDWVIAPAGGICVWCLLNTYAESGMTGELYVYPLSDEDFSWATAAPSAYQGTSGEDSMATDLGTSGTTESLSNVAAWALFNPSSNCRG